MVLILLKSITNTFVLNITLAHISQTLMVPANCIALRFGGGSRTSEVNIFILIVEIVNRCWNHIATRNSSMWCATVLIFIVIKFDNDLLHTRNPTLQFPDWTLGDLGLVETSGLGKDGHDVLSLVKASFCSRGKSHDVIPRQSNQFARIIFILDVIGFGINVESLDTGQNPTSILIGTSDLKIWKSNQIK